MLKKVEQRKRNLGGDGSRQDGAQGSRIQDGHVRGKHKALHHSIYRDFIQYDRWMRGIISWRRSIDYLEAAKEGSLRSKGGVGVVLFERRHFDASLAAVTTKRRWEELALVQ